MKTIRIISYCVPFMVGMLALTAAGTAAENAAKNAGIKQPVTQRFAAPGVKETPQFQQHVVPLLGKLGCNGRACHGSFQGKGDFRLSLFGYDFAMDHKQLTAEDVARINLKDPAQSLVLQKALEEVDHEGGQRFEPNSWQHRLLSRWIENGAQGVPKDAPKFERLEITPNAIQFTKEGETVSLRAVAYWSDGTKEDVTPLCRFQTNNEQIATISESGLVTAAKPGDTHVVVFYDSGVIPVPVLQPVSDQYGKNYPQIAANTKIDKLVVNKLQKLGMVPAETCDDAEFLRRVSLDITGTLPAPHEIEAFLKNSSPNKRSEKIDELIESPGYAAWWTTKLCDFTQNNYDDLVNVAPVRELPSQHWYDWIKKRVVDNEGYDKIVEGILLATSREPGEDFEQFTKSMNEIYKDKPSQEFADRDQMPYYWARRTFKKPEDRVLGFAYTFLGIRIQCAQCHKHPFDQWTQTDFNEFRGFFTRVNFGVNPTSRQEYTAMVEELGADKVRGNQLVRELNKQIKNGKDVPFMEVYVPKARPQRANNNKNKKQKKRRNNNQSPATAKLLGAEVVEINKMDDPRTALMEWLRREDNPYFAKAFVNRVWASYFNRGIIEPPDDLNLANPPSNGPLLDYLSREFVRRDFDMKWLHREIANSDTYQRSWKTNKTNELDEVNFSHFIPRRLPAEVLYDAIHQATASDDAIDSLKNSISDRAIGIAASGVRNRAIRDKQYALTIFGRSTRENNCDCDRSVDPSLLQTMYIKNDNDVYSAINRSNSSWLFQVGQQLGAVQKPNEQKEGMNDRMAEIKERVKAAKQRVNQLKKQENKKKQLQETQKRLRTLTAQLKKMKQTSSRMATKGPARIQTFEKPISADKTEEIITKTYLRSLSRYPTESEKMAATKYLNESQDKIAGVYDLIWAVINTKEFMLNH